MMVSDLSSGGRKSSRISAHQAPSSAKFDRQRNLTLKARPRGIIEPLGRSSMRSKGSSNSSEDKVKVCKNCLRKMVEFLFTQVGVGAVVVCYTIVGASIFQARQIEVVFTCVLITSKTCQANWPPKLAFLCNRGRSWRSFFWFNELYLLRYTLWIHYTLIIET